MLYFTFKIILEIAQRALFPIWEPQGTWGPLLCKILKVGIGIKSVKFIKPFITLHGFGMMSGI